MPTLDLKAHRNARRGMAASKAKARVVIVGAGPVGMVCALALNRRGIAGHRVRAGAGAGRGSARGLDPSAHAGDARRARRHREDPAAWPRVQRLPLSRPGVASVVAEFDLGLMRDEFRFPFVLQYEQYKLTASIAAEYGNAADFDVRFAHAVTGLTQTAAASMSRSRRRPAPRRLRADYVIGCDGGRSTVRKLAGIEFEGFTYPERFIKIATSFDFGDGQSQSCLPQLFLRSERVVQPVQGAGQAAAGLWRAILPIQADETDEDGARPERIEERLQKFFPKTGRYEIEYVNVYGVHQRVAATFRNGRVLLAGDSAHVNNPIGGMGMNGGIHDAINLAEKLARVIHGEAGDELLDLYSRQRRHAAVKYVQAQTIANKRLMEERDPAVRKRISTSCAAPPKTPRPPGLYAPRRAVSTACGRRRGDLTAARATCAAAPRDPHPRTVTLISQNHRTGPARRPCVGRVRRASVHPTVRLGITGLSRAGKTVFITALVHGLMRGGRFPVFEPLSSGRIAGARLAPQPDDAVPRFDYERHVRALVNERMAEIDAADQRASHRDRLSVRQRRDAHADARYRRLSRRVAARPAAARQELRAVVGGDAGASRARRGRRCRPLLDHLATIDPLAPADENAAIEAARLFTAYLQACREEHTTLSMLRARALPDAGRSRRLAGADLRAARLPATASRRPARSGR